MVDPGATCWELIEGAASGETQDRAEFVRRYGDVARAYLLKRWARNPVVQEIDDAVQDVYVECFRDNGVIEKADPGRPGGFRAFYFGVIRNVARRLESRLSRRKDESGADIDLTGIAATGDDFVREFDRIWAQAIIRQAGERMLEIAESNGPDAEERVALLRLRFYQEKPIREIARLWDRDAKVLHREYAKARTEFETALTDVVATHHRGPPGEIHRECERLLSLFA